MTLSVSDETFMRSGRVMVNSVYEGSTWVITWVRKSGLDG